MPFFTLNKFALSMHTKQIKLLILLGHYSTVASVSTENTFSHATVSKIDGLDQEARIRLRV